LSSRIVKTVPEHAFVRYKPLGFGCWLLWGGAAAGLIVLPLVFKQGFALTLMSQMGVMVVFALSYNMLLGQGGMLSFGHAVYAGLGAYFAIHTLNLIGKGTLVFPVTLLPLVGGIFGALFGVLFGWVTTKKAGTTFAMISLGIGEMVAACSLMLPGFFGGEGGITTNRQMGEPFFGITYGPALQVYYLIAAWTLLSTAAMYALTQTPLGRIANAVRDNPERAGFIGFDTHVVRFLQLVLASFFAGVSGGLSMMNFEIVSAENVGTARSGGVLLATFIGGVGLFFGPIVGAVIYTFFVVAIAGMTKAWLLYLGLFFMAMVLYAPGGVASLLLANLRVVKAGLFSQLAPAYGAALVSGVATLAGLIVLVEMFYHLELEAANNPVLRLFGLALDVTTIAPWIAAAVVLMVGSTTLWWTWRGVRRRWDKVSATLVGHVG
jgi:branched-chain amino acid transport system permease protein